MRLIKEKTLKKENSELYEKIISYNIIFSEIGWCQKVYNYENSIIEIPKCKNCGKDVKFHHYSRGYPSYCSSLCNLKSNEIKEKRKKTKIEKYGNENYNNREKARETCLNYYGETSPIKNKDILKKRENTNILKYGETTPLKNNEIKNKIKQTNLEKYGVEYCTQNVEIKNKTKKTNLEKYGVEHQMLTDATKNKIKQTNIEKYGCENAAQNIDVKEKIKQTIQKNFKNKWAKILNIKSDDIVINEEIITINNHCSIHCEFNITKTILRGRYRNNAPYCTQCFPTSKLDSIPEKEIKLYIEKELNIKTQKTRISNKEIDIYIPSHNIGIEYDGLYWHSVTYKDIDYHLNKTILCEKKGIELIHIFEDEWLYKKNIVKNLIKLKLNIFDQIIKISDCTIKEIFDNSDQKFLNENDILGYSKSLIKIGLYCDNVLIYVMTFNKTKKKLNNSYDLNRLCGKGGIKIVGGLNELLKFFIKKYKPRNITTYIDRRYSNEHIFIEMNFSKIKIIPPICSYFINNEFIRYNKLPFNKKDNNKYFEIFDCGGFEYLLSL